MAEMERWQSKRDLRAPPLCPSPPHLLALLQTHRAHSTRASSTVIGASLRAALPLDVSGTSTAGRVRVLAFLGNRLRLDTGLLLLLGLHLDAVLGVAARRTHVADAAATACDEGLLLGVLHLRGVLLALARRGGIARGRARHLRKRREASVSGRCSKERHVCAAL
jgi:hypothetical protein